MIRLAIYIFITALLLSSCRVIDPVAADRYFGPPASTTRLQLYPDSTFELALLDPGHDSLLLPGVPFRAFTINGTWTHQGKNEWLLKPSPRYETSPTIDDSISRFTTINSFSFWDKYGTPVNIRSIRFGKSRPKPHYGNSLYFFAQDFYEADTVRFEMDGYEPFTYPGSIPWAMGNNGHKITIAPATGNFYREPIVISRRGGRIYFRGSRKPLVER